MPAGRARSYVGLARAEGVEKSAIACPSQQGVADHLSIGRSVSSAQPPVRAADAAACDRIWGAHPFRADRLARALAARSGGPAVGVGGSATVGGGCLARSGRRLRHIENAHTHMGRAAAVCAGNPSYRFGWHVDLRGMGPHKNAVWHCACVVAWQFWNTPSSQIRLLRHLQATLWPNRRTTMGKCRS
jgi:hypothetical protein